jgi:hypothetical protein
MKKVLCFILLSVVLISAGFSQTGDMNQVNAREEFRLGVTAFHAGFYNKAIMSFEKSLSLVPDDTLVRGWLARTLYQSGVVDAALYEWDNLISLRAAGSALIQFVEFVRLRYGLGEELREEEPWVPFFHFPGKVGDNLLFHRPASIVPVGDGTGDVYLASFMTNEILRITPNGIVLDSFKGGLDGYDHPFGVLPAGNGTFLITEYKRDILSLCRKNGHRSLSIGSPGIKEGQLKGPQYLCDSGDGYFYVSDYGNRRISKFDYEGQFLLNLGQYGSDFIGFKGPTGIAVRNGLVYAADVSRKMIHVFDGSGNFIETLIEEGLHGPEGLAFLNDEILLIADTDQLLRYNLTDRTLIRLTNLDGEAERLTGVCVDENGYILLSDFNKNRITMLTEVSTLYSGIFVRIDRVDSNRFPEVRMDITVEDRYGNPVTGLDQSNFVLSEGDVPVGNFSLKRSGFKDESLAISVVVDSRFRTVDDLKDRDQAVMDLLKLTGGNDTLALITTGGNPEILSRKPKEFPSILKKGTLPVGIPTDLDAAFRLGASELLSSRSRRTLLYVTPGKREGENNFERYGLLELSQYMKNNGIRFFAVYTEPGLPDEDLDYLADFTGGGTIYLYQPAGMSVLTGELRTEPNGTYTMVYKSKARTDFGRAYIPVQAEVIYLKKSGRDELGYFAPGDYKPSK